MEHHLSQSNLKFRQAHLEDINSIWEIIKQAKAQMHRLGSTQWSEEYPLYQTIVDDINREEGYVFCDEHHIMGYGVISYNGEAAYHQIEQSWNNDLPYLTVHRLAVADRAKHRGLGLQFMREAENHARTLGISNFRVDTNFDNHYMLRIIEKMGFHYVGDVVYRETQQRMAFEKTILPTYHDFGCVGYTLREIVYDDSTKIFNGIDKYRQDMRRWLPFIDDLNTINDERAFINSVLCIPYPTRNLIFAIEHKNELCGLIGYSNSNFMEHHIEIGYWLLPIFRNQGIMTKAVEYICNWSFQNRDIKTIYIKCAVNNHNSNRIPQKLGFKLESTLENGQLLVDKSYTDLNIYSLQKVKKA